MKKFLYTFFKVWLFWILFFALFRTLFILVNLSFSNNTPFLTILESYGPGLRMDLSFSGYLMIILVVMQLAVLPFKRRFCEKCIKWQHYLLIPVFTGLLLGDINLFRYWGGHLNREALAFLKTPGIILHSVHWVEVILFFAIWALLSFLLVFLFNRQVLRASLQNRFKPLETLLNWGLVLFLGALMILPIRGSFSVAPINTGAAYFSNYLFANNAAVNPLWNLGYSLKRNTVKAGQYHFFENDDVQTMFSDLMNQSGEYPKVLNTERPNIVVILLESFSAQAVEALGGEAATPNLSKLMKEGIFFKNLFSTSFRSDYGMVGVLTGFPGLPAYSIMQYPDKSRNLNFIPHQLKNAGYKDFNFLYGGDMAFKNMKSLITFAGFDDVVDIDQFPADERGEKWGVHDEFTLHRFAEMLAQSQSPSFNFMFTLSSHEPFDVPMKRTFEDDYLNSVYYTDSCLGEYFRTVKENGLWDNTLFVLVADHGVVGPEKLGYNVSRRYRIPMLWTGGALDVRDTVVNTYGSQIDLAATLLTQLNIKTDAFKFSKNLLDKNLEGFSFMQYPGGFGYVDKDVFEMFDKDTSKPIVMKGTATRLDSIKAKVFMQTVAEHFKTRLSNGNE